MKNFAYIIALILILLPLRLLPQEKFATEYKIGPQDLLEITVLGEEDFNNFRVRVSEEGTARLPRLGDVIVEGLSAGQLEEKLRQLLEDWLVDPQVTVFIAEHLSKVVYIIGAVASPGSYELLGRQRLVEMIVRAGGITAEAGDRIALRRLNIDGTYAMMDFSVRGLLERGDMNQNVPLQSNDIIHVMVDGLVPIYVGGQVGVPGMIEMRQSSNPSLLRAIIQAGGFIDRANQKGVLLKRIDENSKEVTRSINVKNIINGINQDIPLLPGDVVYVPKTTF